MQNDNPVILSFSPNLQSEKRHDICGECVERAVNEVNDEGAGTVTLSDVFWAMEREGYLPLYSSDVFFEEETCVVCERTYWRNEAGAIESYTKSVAAERYTKSVAVEIDDSVPVADAIDAEFTLIEPFEEQ